MPKASLALLAVALLAIGGAIALADDAEVTPVKIDVSPSVLNLESSGVWVTVHADIPASTVQAFSVTLNGVPVDVVKSDSHGDLVAKFPLDAVKAILSTGTTSLTLSGKTVQGVSFQGTQSIRVVSVKGGR